MRKTKQEVHGGGEENVKELGVRVEDVEERARKTKNTSNHFIKARLSDKRSTFKWPSHYTSGFMV